MTGAEIDRAVTFAQAIGIAVAVVLSYLPPANTYIARVGHAG